MMSRLKYTPVCVSPMSRSRVSAFSEPSLLLFVSVFFMMVISADSGVTVIFIYVNLIN